MWQTINYMVNYTRILMQVPQREKQSALRGLNPSCYTSQLCETGPHGLCESSGWRLNKVDERESHVEKVEFVLS